MDANELRIGNLISYRGEKDSIVDNIGHHFATVNTYNGLISGSDDIREYEPIPLTEEWLIKFGFDGIDNKLYINSKQWIFQVQGHNLEKEINRDGTWFDGIGTHSFEKDGSMAVSVLCRGNYVCDNIKHVHTLQNLYFSLCGEELKIPSENPEL